MSFILIPDFEGDKSVIVMKAHHVLCDALGFAGIFLSISDQAKVDHIPTLKPLTTC